jgi:hypothetical protein
LASRERDINLVSGICEIIPKAVWCVQKTMAKVACGSSDEVDVAGKPVASLRFLAFFYLQVS